MEKRYLKLKNVADKKTFNLWWKLSWIWYCKNYLGKGWKQKELF